MLGNESNGTEGNSTHHSESNLEHGGCFWVLSSTAWAITAVPVFIAIAITCRQFYLHLKVGAHHPLRTDSSSTSPTSWQPPTLPQYEAQSFTAGVGPCVLPPLPNAVV